MSGALTAWKAGYTGNGVDVAVIDTGTAPVTSLNNATKVVVGPDLSFESQAANLRYLDTFGHGTARSSITAGREVAKGTGASYTADSTTFYGIAPDARIISLKLGDRNGTVDVSQLIAAIAAVVSGAAALLYQTFPSMTPGDVQEMLTRTATPLKNTSRALQGRGELNVAAALNSTPMSSNSWKSLLNVATGVVNTGLQPATGTGIPEDARGSFHVSMDGVTLSGERDIMSSTCTNSLLTLLTESLTIWSADGSFNFTQWICGSFANDVTTVAGQTWGGRSWSAAAWNGRAWSSADWPAVASRPDWAASQWSTSSWN